MRNDGIISILFVVAAHYHANIPRPRHTIQSACCEIHLCETQPRGRDLIFSRNMRAFKKSMKKMKRTISEVKGIWSKPHLSFFFCLSCLFSCIGSGVYHACSGCRIGGYLDITSIFIQFWSVFVLLLYQLLILISATKTTDENNADINTNNEKKN